MKTNNPLPKYQIIYEELKEAVSEGKLSPGEKFPSEKQLMTSTVSAGRPSEKLWKNCQRKAMSKKYGAAAALCASLSPPSAPNPTP